MADWFAITELSPCSCGMRRFEVADTRPYGDPPCIAHVGYLSPHDRGHDAVRALLAAERASDLEPDGSGAEVDSEA